MPKLTLVVERTALKVYDIDQPIIRVGREMGLEVVIDNVAVSRHQAELRLQDEQWFARDLGSGNGTLLNGRQLAGMVPIKRGDEISFGKFSLFFDHVPTEPAPQPLRAAAKTGYAEPGRTLVMRPEELAKLREAIVEKRRAHVRWQAGDDDGTYVLADSVVIGHGEDCDLRVEGGPKHHLHIDRIGPQYEVRNTSWWHRMRVNDAPTRHAVLRDGDEIEIGGLKLTFKDDIR